jgi:hypothetical protein
VCVCVCVSILISKLDQLTDFPGTWYDHKVIGCHLIATFFFKFPARSGKDMADERNREAAATLALLIEALVLMVVHLLKMYILYVGKELFRMRNNKMAAVRFFFYLVVLWR